MGFAWQESLCHQTFIPSFSLKPTSHDSNSTLEMKNGFEITEPFPPVSKKQRERGGPPKEKKKNRRPWFCDDDIMRYILVDTGQICVHQIIDIRSVCKDWKRVIDSDRTWVRLYKLWCSDLPPLPCDRDIQRFLKVQSPEESTMLIFQDAIRANERCSHQIEHWWGANLYECVDLANMHARDRDAHFRDPRNEWQYCHEISEQLVCCECSDVVHLVEIWACCNVRDLTVGAWSLDGERHGYTFF